MTYYKTSELAKIIGVHANTVRLYEKRHLIAQAERLPNGYRRFTELHLEQFKLARAALRVEILQNGLRQQAVAIIKTSAAGNYTQATALTLAYITQIETEQDNAEEAIAIAQYLLTDLTNEAPPIDSMVYTRKQAANHLNVTIDTLRNWELNGLFTAKRQANGYRIYTEKDLKQLKIIRSLRCANYSLAAILRMLRALSSNPQANIRAAIDTPTAEDDIISACDKLLTSLYEAKNNAYFILEQLEKLTKIAAFYEKPSIYPPK